MSTAPKLFPSDGLPEIVVPVLPKHFDPDAHDPNVYDPKQIGYRISYAERTILSGATTSSRTFDATGEMGDGDEVVEALLRRALKNPALLRAMHVSRLCNLASWIGNHPEMKPAFDAIDPKYAAGTERL